MAFCKFCGTEIPEGGNCLQCNPQTAPIEAPAEAVVDQAPAQANAPVKAFCKFCGTPYPVGGACPNGCTAPAAAPAAATAAFSPLKTNRSILLYILLAGITLGIYPLVLMYRLSKDINTIASPYDEQKTPNYIVAMLLSGLTLGIYSLVWGYKLSVRIGAELQRRNIAYEFGSKDFWLWHVLGTLIGIGPIIYNYKLFEAMNKLSENFNAVELGIPSARPAVPVQQRVPATVGAPAAPGASQAQPANVGQMGAPVAVATQPAVPKTDAQENLAMGILAYLGPLFLVPLFGAKKSKFARHHTAQGFNVFLGEVGVVVVSILLGMFKSTLIHLVSTAGGSGFSFYKFTSGVGVPFTIINVILWLGVSAFAVIGIINAVQGKENDLPIFGKAKLLQVSEEGEPDFKATGSALLQLLKKVPKIAYIILAAIVGVLILTSITLSIVDSAKLSSARKQAAAIAAQAEEDARRAQEEADREYEAYTEPPTEAPAAPTKTLDAATPNLVFTPADLTLLGNSAISEGYVGMVGGLENGFEFSYTAAQQGTAKLQAAVRAFEGRPYSIYVNGTLFREVDVPGADTFSVVADIPVSFGTNTIKIVGTEAKYWAPDFATLTLTLNADAAYIELSEFGLRIPADDSLAEYSATWKTDQYQVTYGDDQLLLGHIIYRPTQEPVEPEGNETLVITGGDGNYIFVGPQDTVFLDGTASDIALDEFSEIQDKFIEACKKAEPYTQPAATAETTTAAATTTKAEETTAASTVSYEGNYVSTAIPNMRSTVILRNGVMKIRAEGTGILAGQVSPTETDMGSYTVKDNKLLLSGVEMGTFDGNSLSYMGQVYTK